MVGFVYDSFHYFDITVTSLEDETRRISILDSTSSLGRDDRMPVWKKYAEVRILLFVRGATLIRVFTPRLTAYRR